jgi:hypothetical protein
VNYYAGIDVSLKLSSVCIVASPLGDALRSPSHDNHRFRQARDDRGHAEATDAGGVLIYRANFRFRL